MSQEELLNNIIEYFGEKIFGAHRANALGANSTLKSYKINPIVSKYLSKIIENDFSSEGIAKALYYPRVLGTSINTTFGTQIQNMFVDLGMASGSLIKGIDIEYDCRITGRRKWCQLKSGPNTINSEDVSPIIKKFDSILNLARTNNALKQLSNNDLNIGILYGAADEISQHYRKIDKRFPVIVGANFWHSITGYENFYAALVVRLDELIINLDTDDFFERGLANLTTEIEEERLLK